ncbi:endo-1,4-beta-xylanase 5 isoform X1 [Nicotiana tabacum]|uniref:Exoglucanase/xylanase isoform X1 n=2 Tax=Nicotiana tabacum TaxID=4097 RepID=A0A1S4CWL2_TOBAC|nr:PREDICTED: exoglucanase/xylanase-like isoform X1 [Nicotiana tabacum]XP_016505524.1 PREDICTED: exoglucanase/xylanase-like isoform X1 [Nicotiana tabacum]
MKRMRGHSIFCLSFFYWVLSVSVPPLVSPYDGPLYDSSAFTECKLYPEKPLYGGGILKDKFPEFQGFTVADGKNVHLPVFRLQDLTPGTIYSFSTWIKIKNADSSLITASVGDKDSEELCVGTVDAKPGCWSFLKGGFVASKLNLSSIYLKNSDQEALEIEIASASLQPFTEEQWILNQQTKINMARKRAVTIHVSNKQGVRLEGAILTIEQVSKDFLLGSAIAYTFIGNTPYQNWFLERFNAAVFEDEIKWYTTEPKRGQLNYTLADQLLEFVRRNQITVRGHNIFWEDPKYTPGWVQNLTDSELKSAVNSRIQSLMSKYKDEFVHWDVNNELLHFDFYEQRLGPNATLEFYRTVHQQDPLATLFLNEFNVVENCDSKSTVDKYISKIRELKEDGMSMDGIGLEGHFGVPNRPRIRATLDKLATLGLPIWLTEVDISETFSKETQAIYLEQVLREAFSHPAVDGIMLWSAIRRNKCYRMCLTDPDLNNLPTGNVVDKLLKEWETGVLKGQTVARGSYSFYGFLGDYKVTVSYGGQVVDAAFSLSRSEETKHFSIQL